MNLPSAWKISCPAVSHIFRLTLLLSKLIFLLTNEAWTVDKWFLLNWSWTKRSKIDDLPTLPSLQKQINK